MSYIAVYQPSTGPMREIVFAPGVDELEETKKLVPVGVPFWFVTREDLEAAYAANGEDRDAWVVDEKTIGREPYGYGEGEE